MPWVTAATTLTLAATTGFWNTEGRRRPAFLASDHHAHAKFHSRGVATLVGAVVGTCKLTLVDQGETQQPWVVSQDYAMCARSFPHVFGHVEHLSSATVVLQDVFTVATHCPTPSVLLTSTSQNLEIGRAKPSKHHCTPTGTGSVDRARVLANLPRCVNY